MALGISDDQGNARIHRGDEVNLVVPRSMPTILLIWTLFLPTKSRQDTSFFKHGMTFYHHRFNAYHLMSLPYV